MWKPAGGKFNVHGNFSLKLEGRIVTLDCTGPWNEEYVEAVQKESSPIIETLEPDPWCVLVIARGEAVHIPESRAKAIETVKSTKSRGRIATAIIVLSETNSEIIRRFLEIQYDAGHEKYRFFDTESSAREWLKEQLSLAVS